MSGCVINPDGIKDIEEARRLIRDLLEVVKRVEKLTQRRRDQTEGLAAAVSNGYLAAIANDHDTV